MPHHEDQAKEMLTQHGTRRRGSAYSVPPFRGTLRVGPGSTVSTLGPERHTTAPHYTLFRKRESTLQMSQPVPTLKLWSHTTRVLCLSRAQSLSFVVVAY